MTVFEGFFTAASSLREVRSDLRSAILAATAQGDLDRILELSKELGKTHPAAAGLLADLADQFEYDRIRQLFQDQAAERPEDRP